MNAEIISVGTELLLGQTINTDAVFVARELSAIGINLLYTTVVGDNPQRLEKILKTAYERSDIIITTGGLGPTEDDLTKEIITKSAGSKLVCDEKSLARINEYFTSSGRTITENQKKQALVPENAVVFENNNGTAPGCAFKTDGGKYVLMLPGPPSELVPMLKNSAVPFLLELEHAVIYSENIHVFGKGEGEVAYIISDYVNLENPTVATYAKDGEMFVRITAKAANENEARALLSPVSEKIEKIIGDFVYTDVYDSLEELAVNLLRENGLTISSAESCTGGLIAKRITDIPGASQVLKGSAVTYTNEAKMKLLGVSSETLEKHGAVSSETAFEMAKGARALFGTDLALSVTGIAGPEPEGDMQPGLIYIALADKSRVLIHRLPGGGKRRSRESIRNRAASHALDMVRRYIENKSQAEENKELKTGYFSTEDKL